MSIAGADVECEATCADRSLRTQQRADDDDRSRSGPTDFREEKSMLSKANIAAVAALLAAFVAPVGAYAQSHDHATSMPGQSRHLKARAPAYAHGSLAAPEAFPAPAVRSGGRWFETDPDPRIRFEMNRDDRDRRAN
jgi:hypothetical protein